MQKRALLIAFHFPPCGKSSGIQRALKFATYLSDYGWAPEVLTAHPRSYEVRGDHQLKEIPKGMKVTRAFSLDASRHLAIAGRYPMFLSLPDRWSSWIWGGVFSGLLRIRARRPDVLWSTYPVASAHVIGWVLHKLTGIPWVADCRDSMTEDDYPAHPSKRSVYQWIERKMVSQAARIVFTTPGTLRLYAGRYPDTPGEKWRVIANGFDEDNFLEAEAAVGAKVIQREGKLRLVHSGVLYPSERDPTAFFDALCELKSEELISEDSLLVLLRATGFEDLYRPMIENREIGDIVKLAPSVPYKEALVELLTMDGLLLFQAPNCNHQIPAKLYEYFRAQKPILALTDRAGDTAQALLAEGISTICDLHSSGDIKKGLLDFIDHVRAGAAPVVTATNVARYSRRAGAKVLGGVLDDVIS